MFGCHVWLSCLVVMFRCRVSLSYFVVTFGCHVSLCFVVVFRCYDMMSLRFDVWIRCLVVIFGCDAVRRKKTQGLRRRSPHDASYLQRNS